MKYTFVICCLLLGILPQCTSVQSEDKEISDLKIDEVSQEEQVEPEPPLIINYRLISVKENEVWLKALEPGDTLNALSLLNRADKYFLLRLDTLVMPDTILTDLNNYSPFPDKLEGLASVRKMIFISYPAQAFAVYANGKRIRWGATSMGKQWTPTPTGLFFTNWKSKKTRSTIDRSWIMEWYFNLANFDGVSMHQYALPGYPASHACVRLFKDDAYWLYHWADEWILSETHSIAAYGTPVLIYGNYPFGERRPWLNLAKNSAFLDISEAQLYKEISDHLPLILERQAQRDSLLIQQNEK